MLDEVNPSTEDVENQEEETTEEEGTDSESLESTNTEGAEEESESEQKEVEEEESLEDKIVKPSRSNERIRELVTQNKLLETLLLNPNFGNRANQFPVQEEEKLPEFENPELEKAVQARIKKTQSENINIIGSLADKIDELNAKSDIPNFNKIKDQIETFRTAKIRVEGRYVPRQEAYELLLAKGQIKPVKSSSKSVVKKSPTKIAKFKVKGAPVKGSSKDFSKMTLAEKEAAFGDQTF